WRQLRSRGRDNARTQEVIMTIRVQTRPAIASDRPVQHVVLEVTSATWFGGTGLPNGQAKPPPPTGFNIEVMIHPNAVFIGRTRCNETTRTVTLVVDATVDRLTYLPDVKKTFFIEAPRPSHLSKRYNLVVKSPD